jgi:hypothetical protein
MDLKMISSLMVNTFGGGLLMALKPQIWLLASSRKRVILPPCHKKVRNQDRIIGDTSNTGQIEKR